MSGGGCVQSRDLVEWWVICLVGDGAGVKRCDSNSDEQENLVLKDTRKITAEAQTRCTMKIQERPL